MDDPKFRSQIEVLSVVDKGRRREWTDVEKVRIVEESLRGYRQCAATALKDRRSTDPQTFVRGSDGDPVSSITHNCDEAMGFAPECPVRKLEGPRGTGTQAGGHPFDDVEDQHDVREQELRHLNRGQRTPGRSGSGQSYLETRFAARTKTSADSVNHIERLSSMAPL